jgi:large subunit ribosomal protein L25
MSKTVSLQVSQRAGIGRTALKAVRKAGRVPGVLYGKAKDKTVNSRPIEIDAKKLASILHASTSENVLVDVELTDKAGKKVDQHLALLLDVQHHPIKDYIIHIDLHEIAQDEILHAEVPVTSVGEPAGVKTGGGLLETMLRTIRVACLPRNLPELITVDVSHLTIGHSVHVRELVLPEGVTASNPPELPVFSVFAPKEEVVATPATEVKQPEVIMEKKVDEAAPAAGAKGGKADAKAPAKPEGKK